MKRINKWTCLLAAALMLSACGNEEAFIPAPDTDGVRQTVKIALDIDATDATATLTRAGGDNRVPEGYMLRCIVTAYDAESTKPVTQFIQYEKAKTAFSAFKLEGELRLMAGTKYKIVGWADYVQTKGTDLYYRTADLTNISKITTTAHSGVDAEDAYTGVVDYVTATTPTTPAGKIALTLTRPLTKIQLVKAAYNSGEVAGTCQLDCTLDYSDEGEQTYNALKGTASGNHTTSQPVDNPAGGAATFSPYAYFFMNETPQDAPAVSLTVVVKSGETEYGIKAGEGSEEGKAIEIPQVVKNGRITVKNGGDGTLKLYAIPSSPTPK